METLEKYKRRLLFGLVIGIIITSGLLVFADAKEVVNLLISIEIKYLLLIMLLDPLNYLLRFVKWNYFLKISDIKPDPKINFYIFMSGLSMTMTPGKVGELLKCFLLKEHIGTPVSRTAPIVMAQRLTDGLAMVILGIIGSMAYPYGRILVLVAAALLILIIAIFQCEGLFNIILGKLSEVSFLNKSISFIREFQQSAKVLLSWRNLIYTVGIGVVSWGFEGLIVFFSVRALGSEISILGSFFVIAISQLAGALSFMPGGLGVTEGSMMTILILIGINKETAAATTLLTRFSTLWLGVAIGIVGLFLIQKIFTDKKHPPFDQKN